MTMLQADIQGIEPTLRELAAFGKAGEKAARRAVTKTLRWSGRQIASEVAKASNIPLRALVRGGDGGRGKRVYTHLPGASSAGGSVWIGLNPIKSGYLGTPRRGRGGVRVGRLFFEGAFLARMKSGYFAAFKRRGKARLPIDDQTGDLEGYRGVVERVAADAATYLRDIAYAELNYEVNVKR